MPEDVDCLVVERDSRTGLVFLLLTDDSDLRELPVEEFLTALSFVVADLRDVPAVVLLSLADDDLLAVPEELAFVSDDLRELKFEFLSETVLE